MAIFSNTTEETTQQPAATTANLHVEKYADVLIQPRLSEKAVKLNGINKYVFKVSNSSNKVQVKKAVEKFYGVKVDSVNIVKVEGKIRRYGRSVGKTSDYKKAIVTLKADSKKPEIMKGA